jgi:hypothetical protein
MLQKIVIENKWIQKKISDTTTYLRPNGTKISQTFRI